MPRDQERQEIYANLYAEDYHAEIGHGIGHLRIMRNQLRIVNTDGGTKEVEPETMNKNRDNAKGTDLDQEMIHKNEIVLDHMMMFQGDNHLRDPAHGTILLRNYTRLMHGIVHAPGIFHKKGMNVDDEVHRLQIKNGEK